MIVAVATFAVSAALPAAVGAQGTCNTQFAMAIGPTGAIAQGSTKTITLSVGAGPIEEGTKLTVYRLRYDLDCNSSHPLTLPCTDQGDVFTYQGDTTINSTCGVSWTSNVPGGGNAINEIVFTPSTPVDVPANHSAFCTISFDVKLDSLDPASGSNSDGTPFDAEVVAGVADNDVVCDNGVGETSANSQSGSIPLAY